MTKQAATYVAMPRDYPLDLLTLGDRFPGSRGLVEVVRIETTGRNSALLYVRSVRTERVHAHPVTASGLRSGVQLRADRPRPEALALPVWMGGSGGRRRHLLPLDVPLSNGGGVWLRGHFSPAGVSTSDGRVTTRPEFYTMEAVVPAAKTVGGLALLSASSRRLWGRAQWDDLAGRMHMVSALDGGLAPAGEALLQIGETFPAGDDADAWVTAICADTGADLNTDEQATLLRLAPKFDGSAAELVRATKTAMAPAAS